MSEPGGPTFQRAHTRKQRAARRAQLIRGALTAPHAEVFSVNLSARQAGLSKGTVYNHFGDAEDFYLSALETAAAEAMRLPGSALAAFQGSAALRLLIYTGLVRRDRPRLTRLLAALEEWLRPALPAGGPAPFPAVSLLLGQHLLSTLHPEETP